MKTTRTSAAFIITVIFTISTTTLYAGDLNPPGAPTGTMRTLNEIYAAAFEPVSVPLNLSGSLYLYLKNIPGECVDLDHENWINLSGYTFHIENGADPKAEPYPKFSNLLVAKLNDLASVPLMLKVCNNATIDELKLERAMAAGSQRVVFYRLTLTNVRVTYVATNSAHTPLYEVISFGSFDTIKWEYRTVNSETGQPGPWQIQEWDIGNDGGES